jgi:hypothetical protein
VGEHGAGVPAGEVPRRLVEVLPAARVPVGELLVRPLERSVMRHGTGHAARVREVWRPGPGSDINHCYSSSWY